jgi:hypothetical protein
MLIVQTRFWICCSYRWGETISLNCGLWRAYFSPPDDISLWVWRASVEWYWHGKTKQLGEKPVPVPFCPPQIPHGLSRARIQPSTKYPSCYCSQITSWYQRGIIVLSAVRGEYKACRWTEDFLLVSDKDPNCKHRTVWKHLNSLDHLFLCGANVFTLDSNEYYFHSRNLALPQDSHSLRVSTRDLWTVHFENLHGKWVYFSLSRCLSPFPKAEDAALLEPSPAST